MYNITWIQSLEPPDSCCSQRTSVGWRNWNKYKNKKYIGLQVSVIDLQIVQHESAEKESLENKAIFLFYLDIFFFSHKLNLVTVKREVATEQMLFSINTTTLPVYLPHFSSKEDYLDSARACWPPVRGVRVTKSGHHRHAHYEPWLKRSFIV